MADLADVEAAVVDTLAAALFPGIDYLPTSLATSVIGPQVRLYRGWPISDILDKDLAAGNVRGAPLSALICNVSVFPVPGMTRNMTRYPLDWRPLPRVECALTVTVAGNVATFAGEPALGQLAGVRIGRPVSGQVYSYAIKQGDDLAAIATGIAAIVPGGTASGPTVTSSFLSEARCGMSQSMVKEVRRQQQGIRISVWAPTPPARDGIAAAVDQAFAALGDEDDNDTMFIPLSDGTSAFMRAERVMVDDMPEKARAWRRDFIYTAEYPTVVSRLMPPMLWGVGALNNVPFSDAEAVIADLADESGLPITG